MINNLIVIDRAILLYLVLKDLDEEELNLTFTIINLFLCHFIHLSLIQYTVDYSLKLNICYFKIEKPRKRIICF